MKNKIFLTLLFIVISFGLYAQVTEAEEDLKKQNQDTVSGWKKGGLVSLNFTQVSLSNWAAGGQNSVSATGLLNLFANYKKDNSSWDNYLNLAYGILNQGDNGIVKTDDNIDFSSKYGQKAFDNWYYAVLLNFRTQMAKGYNYPNDSVVISDFLAPAYLLGAIGMDIKPIENLSLFIAPLTSKITIVNNQSFADAGAFGVDPATVDTLGNLLTHGSKKRSEIGGYMKMRYKTDIMENVSVQTTLDLFSNYLHNPQNVDVNWTVLISMKVNKYISASINTQLIYDDDIDITDKDGNTGPRTQFKELLGIGFSYKF